MIERFDGRNDDSDNLGYQSTGLFRVGLIDEVNGPGAEEAPGYPLTRHDLEVLARHWARERLDGQVFCFTTGQSGSREIRIGPYAARRLDRIARILGDDAVREMVAEAEREVREELGEGLWRILCDGTPQERRSVVDDTYKALDYLDRKRGQKATPQRAFEFLRACPARVYFDDDEDMWSLSDSSFGKPEEAKDRLILRVTTARGGATYFPEFCMQRPANWRRPYGLR